MQITFNPAISYRKNSVSQNTNMSKPSAQNVNFGNYDAGVKTAEDFFKKGLGIENFLVRLDRTPENDALVSKIRNIAEGKGKKSITGVIDILWFKKQ